MMTQQPFVKICGIREPEHAHTAIDAGADLIGVVFAESHRRVSTDEACRIAEAVRASDAGGQVKLVGLFVNESPEHMNCVAETVGLDLIQLSGDEEPKILGQLNRPAIGSVRANTSNRTEAETRFERWYSGDHRPWAIIVDTHVPGIYGGTGQTGDWELAGTLSQRFPLVLAGGLNPENVADAIRSIQPFAVDVSSGVETEKRKDHEKIRGFLAAARSATSPAMTTTQREGPS